MAEYNADSIWFTAFYAGEHSGAEPSGLPMMLGPLQLPAGTSCAAAACMLERAHCRPANPAPQPTVPSPACLPLPFHLQTASTRCGP